MDDKRFDDIIKKKAEAFEDTGHDAHALTDFRRRMIDMTGNKSAMSLNKAGYLLGALALFTLINFGVVWYFSEGRYQKLNEEIGQLRDERNELLNLSKDPVLPEASEKVRVDTLYVYRDLLVPGGNQAPGPRSQYSDYTYINADQQLSQELEEFLRANNLLLKEEDGTLILMARNSQISKINTFESDGKSQKATWLGPKYLSEVATFEEFESNKKVEKKKMPTSMLWAMEKHNQSGVDFQFGIEGMYHHSNFDVGTGTGSGGVGFMTEVLFSPAWRLETGVHFGARAYRIDQAEIDQLPESFFNEYPGYNDTLQQLNSLESEALLIKVPINLKRFAPIDHNKRWYMSAGLTPQWSRDQEFDYIYSLTEPDPGNDEFVSFAGAKQEVGGGYYTTTLNLGLGAEVYLDEKLRWQLGIFYQKGLGKAGYEQRRLVSSYGVKSSLWFNKP